MTYESIPAVSKIGRDYASLKGFILPLCSTSAIHFKSCKDFGVISHETQRFWKNFGLLIYQHSAIVIEYACLLGWVPC